MSLFFDTIQYGLLEYGDNPLTFKRTPTWLINGIKLQYIVPEFRSEDYWYLRVKTPTGLKLCGPDEWVQYDGEYYYVRK